MEQFIEKCKQKYNDEYCYEELNYKNIRTKVKIKHNKCNTIFFILPLNFLNYKTPCPLCRKEKGKIKTNKYKEFENEKIIQLSDDLKIIKEFDNIQDISLLTGICKNKKNDIKRCCFLNHQKLQSDKSFVLSRCMNIIWIFNCDLSKIEDLI